MAMMGRILEPDNVIQWGDLAYWTAEHYGNDGREDKHPQLVARENGYEESVGKKMKDYRNKGEIFFTRPTANELALLKYLDFFEP
jgi:hypothetical protein